MYFDSAKKNYHFPSPTSISDLDARYYFPEKPSYSNDTSEIDVPHTILNDTDNFDL